MEAHEIGTVVGIREQDGSMKCRACMNEEDWSTLTQENVITLEELESGERLFYCDYCEEKL
jgi:hypothetical protein